MSEHIKTIDEVVSIIGDFGKRRKSVVTTNGSFDILHAGHVDLLEKARQEGDILVVLLNSDASIKKNKGEKRPIISEDERATVVAGLRAVDYVVIFYEDKPLTYLKKIRPDVHVKGGTYIPERTAEEEILVRSWGGRYKYFELREGLSSTEIIERIVERYRN